MMGTKERSFAPLIHVSLEELVPQDHFYRHLDRTLDLSFVRGFVQEKYAGKGQCTTSTQGRRVYRQVREAYLERVRSYQQTRAYQKALRKRQVWVEPLFAEAKDWHGLRRFRLRLLWRVNIEAVRIAAGQNLKRLLKKRGWGRRPFPVQALCATFLGSFT